MCRLCNIKGKCKECVIYTKVDEEVKNYFDEKYENGEAKNQIPELHSFS